MEGKFLIKHRSGGKYFKPKGDEKIPKNETPIILHKVVSDRMYWTFEKVRGHWGYIKHFDSKKIIHPQGGELDSGDKTPLVLHNDRHDGALFALDVYNHRIVHLNGCFAQPTTLKPNPPDETQVILHSKVSNANNFLFVSPNDPSVEVPVYGKSIVNGKWEILSMVRNSSAAHVEKLTVKIGHSRSKSKDVADESDIKYEISEVDFAGILKENFEVPFSSDTWSEESTQTREIQVESGKTVVTWQYVFTLDHCGTTSMFKSNLLEDTVSELVEPEQLQKPPIEN